MHLGGIHEAVKKHLESKGHVSTGEVEGEPMHPGEMLHHALKMKDQATDAAGHAAAHDAIAEAVKACHGHGGGKY